METQEIIEIAGIIVQFITSIVAAVYVVLTNSKKYELSEEYRRELLGWYEKVVYVITELIRVCETEDLEKRDEMLTQLSALIEMGRFYFPNIIKDDDFGVEKPSAYKGYRHIALEFLVSIYDIMQTSDYVESKNRVRELERLFTSCVFDCVDPNKRKKHLKKYTDISLAKGETLVDWLKHRETIYRRSKRGNKALLKKRNA